MLMAVAAKVWLTLRAWGMQELHRGLTLLENLGVCVGTATFFGSLGPLGIPAMQYGGSPTVIWGWVCVSAFNIVIALCMAELVAAYPCAGAHAVWLALQGPGSPSLAHMGGPLQVACTTGPSPLPPTGAAPSFAGWWAGSTCWATWPWMPTLCAAFWWCCSPWWVVMAESLLPVSSHKVMTKVHVYG